LPAAGWGDGTTFVRAIRLPFVIFGGLVVLQPGDDHPGRFILHLSWLLNPSNASRSRTTASPASWLSPSVQLPTTPSLRRTVAYIVCSSLFVQAASSNELSAALGPKEQLERSAKASAAITLDRTLMHHTTFVRFVTYMVVSL
jgi:hypothetical protein